MGIMDIFRTKLERPKGRVEFYRAKNKDWHFKIIANNGNIIADGGGYNRLAWAITGVKALKKILDNPKVVVKE